MAQRLTKVWHILTGLDLVELHGNLLSQAPRDSEHLGHILHHELDQDGPQVGGQQLVAEDSVRECSKDHHFV